MPPSNVVFFLDRSVGKHHVPDALREAGALVELHDDHFSINAQDADWVQEVSRRGWAILTKDRGIRYRPLELAAIVQANARLFVLTSGNVSGAEMARIILRHRRRIEKIAIGERPPFVARVSQSGVVVTRLSR